MRTSLPPAPRVRIVGGGLAGLAAAVGLVGQDLDVLVLESRPRLGGRASSFIDPINETLVDNCQHIAMGCCTNLQDFCRRVGVDQLFTTLDSIRFLGPNGRIGVLKANPLPAPVHLATGLLTLPFLGWSERVAIARALLALAWTQPSSGLERIPFAEWLANHGQSLRVQGLFWAPILVSALNTPLAEMDYALARKVIVDGFLRHRQAFQVQIPTVPLGELYGTRLESWLADHNVRVRMTTGVRSLEFDADDSLLGVRLRDGEFEPADFVILAVPFQSVGRLLPESVIGSIPKLGSLSAWNTSPITGVHLWFDRSVCPFDHVVLPGGICHWVFNHSRLSARSAALGVGSSAAEYLQIVISASNDLAHLNKEAILELVLDELAGIWPELRSAELVRWWVVTEHAATFAATPGLDRLRPEQRTTIDGLFLAGDWTNTGWPATMEGAVRAGYLAAEGVLRDLDRPSRLLRPDLSTSLLARWLVGPSCIEPGEFRSRRRRLDRQHH